MANDLKVLKTDTPPTALQKLLSSHKVALQKALAKHMDVERLIRISVNAMHRNPTIGNCSMPSIMNSVVLCGVLGLEPNTPLGHAYLIPYGKECTFQPGYRGLMHLGYRSANVKKFSPALVFEGDEFEQELGLNEKLRHVPAEQSDEWVGAYSLVKFADGDASWVYMPKSRIIKIRDQFSQGYQRNKASSPWTTSEDEMAIKTAIKRHIKRLDISIEVARAADLDDQADKDMKQESFIEAEFQQLASESLDAQNITAGSREKQEQVREEKIESLKREEGAPPTEEEMDRQTRETVDQEQRQERTRPVFGKKDR